MSEQLVIQWRTNALYHIALRKLPDNPQWIRQIFQDDPEMMELLIKCIIGDIGIDPLIERIQDALREEARARAEQEIATGSMPIDKIQDTLEN